MGFTVARRLTALTAAALALTLAPVSGAVGSPANVSTLVSTVTPVPSNCSTFEVVAHRGYRPKGVDENSRKAFLGAAVRGFSVELDVVPDAQGVLWVFHDFNARRATGEDVDIMSSTTAEVADLRYRVAQSPLLRLSQAMDIFGDYPDVPVYIEPKKYSTAEAIARQILARDRARTTWLTANFRQVVRDHSEIRGMLKVDNGTTPDAETLAATGADTVALSTRSLSPETVAHYRAAGMKIQARMSNTTKGWRRGIRNGVDGQLTDRPVALRTFCPYALRAPSIRTARATRRDGRTRIVVRGSAFYDTSTVRLGQRRISFTEVSGSRIVATTPRRVGPRSRVVVVAPNGKDRARVLRR